MLKAFYRHLRVKPKKVIMFRDGVSEGQFQEVTVLFSFARDLIFESHQQTDYCEEKIRPIFRFIDLRSSLLHI